MVMGRFVSPLPTSGTDVRLDGRKAAGLSRLMLAGFRVPPAFVVNTEAFRRHMRLAGAFAPFAATGAPLQALRKTITNAPMDVEIAREIRALLRELGPGKLAVRSSLAGEHAGAFSFAGIHDTVLGVEGEEDCFVAIKACWASLYSDRSVDFLVSSGISLRHAAMAVIVQRMVPSLISGVLLTADPEGGRGRIVISAVAGMGRATAPGGAEAERWKMSRENLEVSDRPDPESALLDNRRVRELAETGLKIEKVLGVPQDIEWAIAFGKTHILEARPITVKSVPTDRTIWCNGNTRELLPDPVSPMTWSAIHKGITVFLDPLLYRTGFDPANLNLIGLVGGRVYLNLNALIAVFRKIPGVRRRGFPDFSGGDQAAIRTALSGLRDSDLPRARTKGLQALVRTPSLLWWLFRSAGIKAGLPGVIRRKTDDQARMDIRSLNDSALVDRAQDLLAFDELSSDGFASMFVGPAALGGLARFCRRRFGDADSTLANRLLSGMGGMDTAEGGLELWRLASAGRVPPVAEILLSGGKFPSIRRGLEETGPGRAFLAGWDGFMLRHGHHARMELDLALPRWREQPDYVLSFVRSYLAGDGTSPEKIMQRRMAERKELTMGCRLKLRDLPSRFVFNFLLDRAQRGSLLREALMNEIGRRLALLRETVLESGRRLASRGTLDAVEDVFFLNLGELPAALSGSVDLRDAVSQRRAGYHADKKLSPPGVIIGRFDPGRFAVPEQAIPASVLRGIPVSPGLVEGRARVILHTDRETSPKAGEILVIPFAGPGWTPYFMQVSAIVMDSGGPLSQGSAIARGYGIPTVVNVGPATALIKTGQLLRVNAYSGEVRLL